MSIYIPHLSSIPFKSELYLNRYVKFIESCLEKNVDLSPDVCIEEHHILPKAKTMFPQFVNLRQHPWNAARLTARQHLIAHRMLKKAYMNVPMCRAVTLMAGENERNSRWYEQAKIDLAAAFRELFTGKPKSEESRKKMSEAAKGKPKSEEHRKNISNAHRGKSKSQKHRKKLSDANQGKPRSEETKKKISEKNLGQKHPQFKGFYQTPFGIFDSATAAAKSSSGGMSHSSIIGWCKKDNLKVITNLTFSLSKFLHDNYKREDVVGKTFNDLGFSFISE